MPNGFLLRVKYIKRGRLAYLSHLETIRSMERVIRRAQLPYAITEGFNPHMKVAFGPALPVGAGSCGEYLDLRMKEYVPPEQALAQMQQAAAPNLCPVSCEYVSLHSAAITVEYPISTWEAEFAGEVGEDAAALAAMLQRAFDELVTIGCIEVARKRKAPKLVEFEGRLVETPKVLPRDTLVRANYQQPAGESVGTRHTASPSILQDAGGRARRVASPYWVPGRQSVTVCPDQSVTPPARVIATFATRDVGEGALRPDKFIAAALSSLQPAPRLVALTRTALRRA